MRVYTTEIPAAFLKAMDDSAPLGETAAHQGPGIPVPVLSHACYAPLGRGQAAFSCRERREGEENPGLRGGREEAGGRTVEEGQGGGVAKEEKENKKQAGELKRRKRRKYDS